ncbi:hypothetical protein [Streptomyces sp. NPDC054786]
MNVQGLRYGEWFGDLKSLAGQPAGEVDGSLNRGALFVPADPGDGFGMGQDKDGGGVVMSALEAYSSRRAETPGGASWLYVQHVPVRRLITQLVRKLLVLSAWPEFAAAPVPVTVAPCEGLLGLRDSSAREYRAYTVTWSGVAYALGAPAPYNPERSARLRKLTTIRPDSRLAGTPTPSAVPASELVALSWPSRHAQTLLPVLEELASQGRSSVLVDLATDPGQGVGTGVPVRCSARCAMSGVRWECTPLLHAWRS